MKIKADFRVEDEDIVFVVEYRFGPGEDAQVGPLIRAIRAIPAIPAAPIQPPVFQAPAAPPAGAGTNPRGVLPGRQSWHLSPDAAVAREVAPTLEAWLAEWRPPHEVLTRLAAGGAPLWGSRHEKLRGVLEHVFPGRLTVNGKPGGHARLCIRPAHLPAPVPQDDATSSGPRPRAPTSLRDDAAAARVELVGMESWFSEWRGTSAILQELERRGAPLISRNRHGHLRWALEMLYGDRIEKRRVFGPGHSMERRLCPPVPVEGLNNPTPTHPPTTVLEVDPVGVETVAAPPAPAPAPAPAPSQGARRLQKAAIPHAHSTPYLPQPRSVPLDRTLRRLADLFSAGLDDGALRAWLGEEGHRRETTTEVEAALVRGGWSRGKIDGTNGWRPPPRRIVQIVPENEDEDDVEVDAATS